MVFCLCCGRRRFNRTLVIHSKGFESTSGKFIAHTVDRHYSFHEIKDGGMETNETARKTVQRTSRNDINNVETVPIQEKPSNKDDDKTTTEIINNGFIKTPIVSNTENAQNEIKIKPSRKKQDAPQRPISADIETDISNSTITSVVSISNLSDTQNETKIKSSRKKQDAPKRPISSEINTVTSGSTIVNLEEQLSNTNEESIDTHKTSKTIIRAKSEESFQNPESSYSYGDRPQSERSVYEDSRKTKNVSKAKSEENIYEDSRNMERSTLKAKSEENIYEDSRKMESSALKAKSEESIYEGTRKMTKDVPKLSIDMDLGVSERRGGIAPVPTRIDTNMEELPVHIKDPKDTELIREAIQKNDFLNQIITGEPLKDVIAAMYNKEISAKDVIIRQGDKGSHIYVSAKGTYQIIINKKVVSEFKDVRVFGELAILYNATRQATIKATTSGRVWVLDNNIYQQIMLRHNIRKQDELMNFLFNNEILNVVGNGALQIVANLLKSEFFKTNQTIVRQGDRGNKFYIIRAGTVTITKEGEGVVGVYKKGDCFGELALLEEDARQATVTANSPGVECLTLTRKEFIDHLGEIKKFKYIKVKENPKDSIKSLNSEHQDINLRDLRIIKTLGVGGFGRVELVQHTKIETLVFALKYLKKVEVVQQNQQEHVYNEKVIQMGSRSPFIVRLYKTYKDSKYIYFLMESCLGGDLWSLLQKQKNRRFEEREARFICGCVLEAFEYLHSRGIIYRDLKPENLLIATNGYIKLTDFGFAKKIAGQGKTYTFAGTPEYVAPEIVLNRGHDRAVDYWAFGAFVFEMLCGRTPFRTDDSSHMRTYNKILSGIDNIHFPTYISLSGRHLIEKLCRPVPSERLGMQRHGMRDIKNHKWFLGLDWQKLAKCELHSPFKPKLNGPVDTKYFDQFKRDTDNPPEELSGWDENF